jgi:hypothetical protein
MGRRYLCLIFTALLVSACTRYLLNVNPENNQPTPSSPVSNALSPSDLYAVVYAEAKPPPGTAPLDPCANTFVASLGMDKQVTIVLSAVLQDNTTKVPLYSVTQSGQASCLVDYSGMYIFPPQTIANLQRVPLKGVFLYNVTASEKVSKYLADSTQLAGVVAPQGTPVLAAYLLDPGLRGNWPTV